MPNFRYIFHLISAFLNRFKVIIGISIFLGVLFFFLIRIVFPMFMPKLLLKIGVTGRYTVNNLPISILSKISLGLTTLDTTGDVHPGIASSWESPDKGKTWVFKLRDDLKWQDGKKVLSADINYQFSDVTIQRKGNDTIIFTLQNPYSAFPAVVARPVFKKGLLGIGEWQVKNLALNGNYVEELSIQNKDNERVVYKFYPTEEHSKLAFKMGAVDTLVDIIDPSPLSSWSKIKLTKSVNKGEFVAVFFNTQDKILSDKNVRQALSYAIEKDIIGGERVISPISSTSWAYNPQVKPYNYDLAKAKNMISTLPDEEKKNLNITLSTSSILLPQAEEIKKNWEAIGFAVNLQVNSNISTDYQAILAIFDIPEDPDQYSIWHSTQIATNITHYQNPRIDQLLEKGRSEIVKEDRRKVYLDFQRYLVEDAPAVFLYYPVTYLIERK